VNVLKSVTHLQGNWQSPMRALNISCRIALKSSENSLLASFAITDLLPRQHDYCLESISEKQRQDLDELSANVDPFDIDDDDRHDDGAGVAFEGDVDMKDDLEAVDEKIVDDNKNMV